MRRRSMIIVLCCLIGGGMTAGCSSSSGVGASPSSGDSAFCSDITSALAPFDAANEALRPYTMGDKVGEDVPPALFDEFAATRQQAAEEMRAIAQREDGDRAKLADSLSIYLASTDTSDATAEAAGTLGYLLLGQICGNP